MKKAEIYTRRNKKAINNFLTNPAFVSGRYSDNGIAYIPLGELYGVKILIKYNIKREGTYLILE
jgi:hypothetical protein